MHADFPKKGVNFLDIFSLTEKPLLFRQVMDAFTKQIEAQFGKPGEDFTHVVGLESKGFVLGPILSLHWNLPFVPLRKKGKLPGECYS